MNPQPSSPEKMRGLYGFAGCLRQVAVAFLALVGLMCALMGAVLYTDVAQSLSSEPVYDAEPGRVDPELEGKLVRMRVTELSAADGPAVDALFGLRREGVLAVCRYYLKETHGRATVGYHELDGVPEAAFPAPVVRAGAFRLKAREFFWNNLGGRSIPAEEVVLPAEWEPRLVARTEQGITLRTQDTSQLAAPQVTLCFCEVLSPWQGERFLVGRQRGEVLDLTGKDCGEVRGAVAFAAHTRARPISFCVLSGSRLELGLTMAALLVLTVLCLFPVTLQQGRRSWSCAAVVALLWAVLLTALAAGVFLLLPHVHAEPLAWAFTAGPALVAALVLVFIRRREPVPGTGK